MGVAARMKLLVGIALAGLLVLCLTSLFLLKDVMYRDRSHQTEDTVKVGLGIIDHFHSLAVAGRLSDEAARQAAKDALRGIRYGNNDYYFIFSTEHVYVLNPSKPATEGQDESNLQDSNGKYLARELVVAARKGGGHVDYTFPRAGQTQPEAKLSYAALYEPWGWVLGTGIYIDDIDTEYRRIALILGSLAFLLLAALGFLGWQNGRSIIDQIGGEPAVANEAMREIAHGNLVVDLGNPKPGSLLGSLQSMAGALRSLIREINSEGNSLVASAEDISQASNGVSRAAERQSDATSAIAAAIEELTVSSAEILESAKTTEANSEEAMSLAVQGRERVEQASKAIQDIAVTVNGASDRIRSLESRAAEISSIAGVIKEIAGQTNLLALNAAIEAARAGEAGRGFAVVADEVRQLAERTTAATGEIHGMICAIQEDTNNVVAAMNLALPEVQRGVELASGASDSLRAIEQGAQTTLDRVSEVANATQEQSAASTSIAQHIEQIALMVEETNSTIRENAKTSASLEAVAKNLKSQISRFVV